MAVVEFPFKDIGRTRLGHIWRPYAKVQLQSTDSKVWFTVEMVVDTGADYTLLPKKYAEFLGIDIARDCIAQTSQGIGGAESVYFYQKLVLRLGRRRRKVPVGFLERDDIPALMGRLDFMEKMKVSFERHATYFS